MVVAADDVRDPELDVVDDAGEVVRRRAVLAQEGDLAEALTAQPLGRLAIDVLALALADGAFVPVHAEPLEIAPDLVLAAGNVARCIGVVDAQEHPVAEIPVGDCAERVPDVEGARGARCEADALHGALNLHSPP